MLILPALPTARAHAQAGKPSAHAAGAVVPSLTADEQDLWNRIIGSATLENRSYAMLQHLCDEAGGRLVGTAQNAQAMQLLADELRALGIDSRQEHFTIPGVERGDDVVEVRTPFTRRLRAVALGYVDAAPDIDAPLVWGQQGFEDQYSAANARDAVVLVTQEAAKDREEMLRYEAIEIAARKGARAVLFIHTRPGGLTLAGMSNFQGHASALPAFSVTIEEGAWLRRLLEKNSPVRMHIETRTRLRQVETANTVVTFPGRRQEKIVLGAHFDSWDVGQGGVDNGQGTAVLFDIARLLARYSPQNEMTLELVWFNGEELGLWGSKKYYEAHHAEPIACMINMDMPGSPRGFNAMGSDAFMPFFKNLAQKLAGFDLKSGVSSTPWTNSDHMPFMLGGIPTFTLSGYLSEDMVRHYHDFGDTFDKVDKRFLSDAAGVFTIMARELARTPDLPWHRRTDAETIELLVKHKLDARLKKQGEWPFEGR